MFCLESSLVLPIDLIHLIRSLRILGLEQLALAFYFALLEQDNLAPVISKNSLRFWEKAALRPLHLAPSQDNGAEGIPWLRDDAPD